MEKYLTIEDVCGLIPGMTRRGLAQLRYAGRGPVYLNPTPRKIVYRESDVIEWLESSERTSTAGVGV